MPFIHLMYASPYVFEIVRNSAATAVEKKKHAHNCAVSTRTEMRIGTDVAKSHGCGGSLRKGVIAYAAESNGGKS